jgi:hypothetical protein
MNLLERLPDCAAPPWAAPAHRLRLPGCDRPLAYAAHYWPATLRNLLRPHRLQAEVAQPRLSAEVRIPPALRRAWEALFDIDAGCPLLVNQSVGTLLYTRLFTQLGLNFRRLLHVQHRTWHGAHPFALAIAERQVLTCALVANVRLTEGKALVVLETQVHQPAEAGGALLARVQDGFMIRGVPPSDWARLPGPGTGERPRELLGLRKRRAALDAGARAARVLALPLAEDLGRRYGRVSGDHNPVHTTALAARLFGLPRPFAQGLALRNLIVSELHRLGAPLQSLQLTFAQPAYLGQTARLVLRGGALELLSADGQVIAFGSAGEVAPDQRQR